MKVQWIAGIVVNAWTGNVYVDGSGKSRLWSRDLTRPWTRCGWGAVMRVRGAWRGVCGSLPQEPKVLGEQSVPRAGLFAICYVLEVAILPITIWTDHKNHKDAFTKGKAYCTRWDAPHLDLWTRIWFLVEDLGGLGENLQVRWTPAHKRATVDEEWWQAEVRKGNAKADEAANQGRELHEVPVSLLGGMKGL